MYVAMLCNGLMTDAEYYLHTQQTVMAIAPHSAGHHKTHKKNDNTLF